MRISAERTESMESSESTGTRIATAAGRVLGATATAGAVVAAGAVALAAVAAVAAMVPAVLAASAMGRWLAKRGKPRKTP